MNPIAFDTETFYSKKLKYTIFNSLAEPFCKHPLFDPYLVSVYDGEQAWVGHPRDFNWNALEGRTLLSHNRYFDNSVTNEMAVRGIAPGFKPAAWHCTANLTAYLCNRRSLAAAVEYLFAVKLDKDPRDQAEGKRWESFPAEQQATMKKYAIGDVVWCHRIWKDFSHKWPEVERRLANITIDQGMRGVQINTELLDQYLIQSHEMKEATEKLLPWLEDKWDDESEDDTNFKPKPTSTKCVAEQCRRAGIPCPPVKSDDEEAYDEWELTYKGRHPWIQALSAWRSINKLVKTFQLMKARVRNDGTMPFALKYFGAHTGRWSGDGKMNMQNPRKRPVIANELGLMETDDRRIDTALEHKSKEKAWPTWVRAALDFRALIIPRPGKKMIVSDLSQIEPRVLAWLAGDFKLLDMIKDGMSIYEAHARATMSWAGGVLKKENPKLYALAKARVLGLGFQCGWEKFITMSYDLAGIDITEGDPEFVEEFHWVTGEPTKVSGYGYNSKKTVADYRAQNPKIVDLWGQLDRGMKSSVGDDFIMTLPSGREMRYERVRCEARIEPNKKTGKPERKTVFTAGIGGRRFMFYGGKLAENATQATAREVFGHQIVALEDAGLTNLFSCHDEAILEVDNSVTARDVEHLMSNCPEFLKGCPVAAEAQEVAHYCK